MKKLELTYNESSKRFTIEEDYTTVKSSNGDITDRIEITKNFILVKSGIKTLQKFDRNFYGFYLADTTLIIAEDEDEVNDIMNFRDLIILEVAEDSEKLISKQNLSGEVKKKLTKQEKEDYAQYYNSEVQYEFEYLQCKTIKARAIFLIEKEFPISAIAYCLEKRFQQIRQYAVQYYGKNLKQM
jgi:hypothetical protein